MSNEMNPQAKPTQPLEYQPPPQNNLCASEDVRQNERLVRAVALGGDSRELLTNLDISTEEGQAVAVNCLGSADKKASEVIGQELRVCAAVCGAADYDEGGGEFSTGPAVTLILEGGGTVFVSGALACRQIATLVLFARGKQWNPPLSITIEARKGKRPQPYHVLKVLPRIVRQPGGKGGAK